MSGTHFNNIKNIISLNNYILESLNSSKSLESLLENYPANNKKEELNSDDEPIGGEQNQDEQNQDEQNQDEQMSYDELLSLQFDATNQKFIQLQLFNKIQDLSSMITTINNYSLLNNDEQMKLDHIINYLDILKEIIFISDVNVVYQTLGQLQVEFAVLLNQLNDRLNQEEYYFQLNKQNKQN